MAIVGMVQECVAATPNHYFDISRGFGGSLVGEMGNVGGEIRVGDNGNFNISIIPIENMDTHQPETFKIV
jgi:hypothetical protein